MPPRTPIKGDHSKRVTVPLPTNINDLETCARKTFGGGPASIKMFHEGPEGETQLENQSQFKNVGDGDVVVVRRELLESAAKWIAMTTHQADFVKHPIDPRKLERHATRQSDMDPPKFTGRSCYAGDYVKHALESSDRPRQPIAAWEPTPRAMSGKSTYNEHYPSHPTQPKVSARPSATAPSNWASAPPFQGNSSYKMDYVKHSACPNSARGPSRRERTEAGSSAPFDSSTTYGAYFKKPVGAKRERFVRPAAERGLSLPFKGSSEYRHEYMRRERQRQAVLHLEPERRGSSDGS